MVWATDQTGISLLLDASLGRSHSIFGGPSELVGLSGCYDTLHSAAHAEMGATSMITGAGYTVDVLMASFHKIGDAGRYCESTPPGVLDPLREGDYFGFSIHPYETLFARTTAGMSSLPVENLSSWMKDSGYSSYLRCGV